MEVWKVFGNMHEYRVSIEGKVESRLVKGGNFRLPFRLGAWRELKKVKQSTGYLIVNVRLEGNKTKVIRVHRLVALSFLPNPKNLPQVNHIDGDKTNNKLDNLEWISNKDNMLHAHKMRREAINREV
jgi:Tol biopolymer transport system component